MFKKTQTLHRDLSMSKDMRDSPRATLGFAANMFYGGLLEFAGEKHRFFFSRSYVKLPEGSLRVTKTLGCRYQKLWEPGMGPGWINHLLSHF